MKSYDEISARLDKLISEDKELTEIKGSLILNDKENSEEALAIDSDQLQLRARIVSLMWVLKE